MNVPRTPYRHGTPRRPNIGITPDFVPPSPDSPLPRFELKAAYAEAVAKAGGLPFVLPYAEDPSMVECYLERISGLVVSGGAFDIPPEAYGETPREGLGALKPERTAFETALMKGALARRIPVLGICGGMQLLNVVLGGTLHQDIRLDLPQAREHQQSHDRTQPHHPVDVKDGTQLGDAVGRGALMVNSTHHQSVKALGNRVIASGIAPDGVIEAIESQAHPFAVGVQWHPEYLVQSVPTHLGIYRAFVQRARESRR